MFTRFALLIVSGSLALACHGSRAEEQSSAKGSPEAVSEAAPTIPESSVADASRLLNAKAATLIDANNLDTRREYGVVPGAILLSSSRDYAFSELPKEKSSKLVFYCGGIKCRASDAAAARAAKAGYSDVSVMREGIRGWKGAGQPVQSLPQT
jgi:rhodanese-related sulfurtransferase